MYICWPLGFREIGQLRHQIRPMTVGVAVFGVLEVIVGREPDPNLLGTYSSCHCLDHLKWKPASIINATTVLIVTDVDIVMQKLVKNVTIRA